MTAVSAALRGRILAEALMGSECTVFSRGTDITDPQTGEVTHEQTTVWFGPCRVRPAGLQGSTTEAGGRELFTFDYIVSVPFAVTEILEGHRLTITDSPDPALSGVTVEVQKVERGDFISARRLACSEVV